MVRLRIAFLIRSHERGLGEDMALHRSFEPRFGERLRRKHGVERVELVKIAMPPDRWAGSMIGGLFPVADAGHRAFGQSLPAYVFREQRGIGRQVVEEPMRPNPLRRFRIRSVGVVENKRERPPARQ